MTGTRDDGMQWSAMRVSPTKPETPHVCHGNRLEADILMCLCFHQRQAFKVSDTDGLTVKFPDPAVFMETRREDS